jgi:xanthine dehydrogenase accessory factor
MIYKKINTLLDGNKIFWIATVIKAEGHTPAKAGMKMIVEPGKKFTGTIGGGEIEKKVTDYILENKPTLPVSLDFDLGAESDSDIKTEMICGGTQTVFIEPNNSKTELYIIGGGHCGRALSELAAKVGFKVIVIDSREEILSQYDNETIKTELINYENVEKAISFSDEVFIVIMTHGHVNDELVLEKLIEKKYKYLGMLGSSKKVASVFRNLKSRGIKEEHIEKVNAPIGIEIGSHTPDEIAISIMAQIIQITNKS